MTNEQTPIKWDASILRLLHLIHAPKLDRARNHRQRRQALAQRIKECAQFGRVAVIESGRDCDGTQYSGYRHLIPATLHAYDALRDHLAKWADGAFHLEIARPSEHVEYTARDLALEAFENGHPHSLRP